MTKFVVARCHSFCWLQICHDNKWLDGLFIDNLYPQIGCFGGKNWTDFFRNTYSHRLAYCIVIRFEPQGPSCAVCILLSVARYDSIKQEGRINDSIYPHVDGRIHLWIRSLGGKSSSFLTYEITSSFLFTIKFMSYIDTVGWHSIQYHLVCALS